MPSLVIDGKGAHIGRLDLLLRPIPTGSFLMGSPLDDKWRYEDEYPTSVNLPYEFWCGEAEVSQRQWDLIMPGSLKVRFRRFLSRDVSEYSEIDDILSSMYGEDFDSITAIKDSDYPVTLISFQEAIEYCRLLTESTKSQLPDGYVFRLPTEDEWEYCCRAGTSSRFSFGATARRQLANFSSYDIQDNPELVSGLGKPCKVRTYQPNAFGLFNMHGNASEFCYSDREGSSNEKSCVLRGGSWQLSDFFGRSAARIGHKSGEPAECAGFRIFLAPEHVVT